MPDQSNDGYYEAYWPRAMPVDRTASPGTVRAIAAALPLAVGACLALAGNIAIPAEPAHCPDYILTNEKLSAILGASVRGMGNLVKSSSAIVNPASSSCSVEMKLESVFPNCVLTGCSTAVVEQPRRIGIREFRIQGCNAVFDALGDSKRNVKTAYSDVTAEIGKHCGSDGFRIVDAVPATVRGGTEGHIRVRLEAER